MSELVDRIKRESSSVNNWLHAVLFIHYFFCIQILFFPSTLGLMTEKQQQKHQLEIGPGGVSVTITLQRSPLFSVLQMQIITGIHLFMLLILQAGLVMKIVKCLESWIFYNSIYFGGAAVTFVVALCQSRFYLLLPLGSYIVITFITVFLVCVRKLEIEGITPEEDQNSDALEPKPQDETIGFVTLEV